MPSYSVEFERLCGKRSKEIGRDLNSEELSQLDGLLFQSWIDDGRLDELIRSVFSRFGRDGGLTEIIVLGHHLRQLRDEARVNTLFRGLISRRVKVFHECRPRAREGHIGSMRDASRAAAEAMDVYSEYFISLHALGLLSECETLRLEMLRFQARETERSRRSVD